jgi:hypothetical protein
MSMEKEKYLLEPVNENKFVNIVQVTFGILCLIIALSWLVVNITTFKSTGSVWITIVFLAGFGYFQIISGTGRATKYIEYRNSEIILKANSFLPLRKINLAEIERIEVYPLSILFYLKSGKKVPLRFGTTYTEIISSVKQGTEKFADENNISLSYKKENI